MNEPLTRSAEAAANKALAAATVGDVMTRGVVAAHEDATFKEIVRALVRNHVSCVPVIDGGRTVIGVISESDLLRPIADRDLSASGLRYRWSERHQHRIDEHGTSAKELMSAPPTTVTACTSVAEAARLAAAHKLHRMPVIDETGVLVGIVSSGDLLKIFLRDDDDIRREILERLVAERMAANPTTIAVSVTEGIVELAGQLESRQLVKQLEADVRREPGVVAVRSKLTSSHPAALAPDLYTPRY